MVLKDKLSIGITERMFKNYVYHAKHPSKKTTFEIHGLDLAIVNGIRRTILTDIPVVGMCGEPYEHSTVQIETNNGPLHNEFMIHRIGLIPLHLSESETDAFQEDQYEIQCQVSHTGAGLRNVSSHDFKIFKGGALMSQEDHRRIFPVHSVTQHPILLTRLRTNETLTFKASLAKQTAALHASFAPVSVCTYQFLVNPKKAAKITNPLEKERAYERNTHGEPTGFAFQIEPINALSIRYIFAKAVELLIHKLEQVVIHLQEPHDSITHGIVDGLYEFRFQNENDTLGNLLQSLMHTYYIWDANPARAFKLGYVGYVCPHPLEPTMLLRLKLEGSSEPTPQDYIGVLKDSCERIRLQLEDVRASWLRFVP
jgi:DNA-directed RNA polymerase subunit L